MNRLTRLPTEVVIYTDGGVEPNPGPGGWGAILICDDENGKRHTRELKGPSEGTTTNNRMEIQAMIEGLKALTRPVNVTVYTDSQYLQKSIGHWKNGKACNPKGWVIGWRANGWRRKDGPLKNSDLWRSLVKLCEGQKSVSMRWVRGHSGDYYNERCDALATEARTGRGWDAILEDITEDD